MKNLKVSIVIPVFNAELYLKDCVYSVLAQTYKNIEVILVDDGSVDSSGLICDQLAKADSRIKVIHQKNKGPSAARNKGIEAAKGKYIGFIDSDDTVEKDMIEILVEDAIISKSDMSMITQAEITLKGQRKCADNSGLQKVWSRKEAISYLLSRKIIDISVHTKLFRAELCHKIKFVESRTINEDKFFIFQTLMLLSRVSFRDICKYNYIKRENSVSTCKFNDSQLDMLYFAEEIHNQILKKDKSLVPLSCFNLALTRLEVLHKIYRAKDSRMEYRHVAKKITRELSGMDRQCIDEYLSTQKKIEIFVVSNCPFLYAPLIKIFDLLFR